MNKAISGMNGIMVMATMLASFALASCGGGGGAPGQPNPGGNGVAPGTTNLEGQLVQGSNVKASSTIGAGLPGIQVKLIRSSTGQLMGSDFTDSSGHYEFKGVPSGNGYLLKLEFLSSQDLNGDGALDEVELYFPLNLADQASMQLLQRIGVSDSDSDGELDAVEVEFHFSDDMGHEDEQHSQHRHRSGETRIDDDGDGSFDDSFDDSDADGLPDDSSFGGFHEQEVHGNITAIDSSSITVNGVTFSLGSGTVWRIGDDRNADPSQFTVGTSVEVEGYANGSGGWIASKVQLDDEGSNGSGDDSGDDDSGDDGSDDDGGDDD